jgi:tetratricopeptide (TPR) repeat protein
LNIAAEKEYHLAIAWQIKGRVDRALHHYQKALDFDPQHEKARNACANLLVAKANLQVQHGSLPKALESCLQAENLNPVNRQILLHLALLREKIDHWPKACAAAEVKESKLPNNPSGKLNMQNQKRMIGHRSGWAYVLCLLQTLHNEQGILFDGVIENNFAWQHLPEGVRSCEVLDRMRSEGTFEWLASSEEKGITPYLRPWVGIFHNPPGIPEWFMFHTSPQAILRKELWRKSLPYCVGLFAFSNYLAGWLGEQTRKPVSALIHPTEIPHVLFNYNKFRKNPGKKIIQIGWWLRRVNAIYQLPIPRNNPLGYVKVRTTPLNFSYAELYFENLLATERKAERIELHKDANDNTVVMPYVSNDDYDELLSENIGFVHLYDASVNNAVIECIARGTPLLVNRLPAVVEYLGLHYPYYFDDLEEAKRKALDLCLIQETHEYLMTCDTRRKLTSDYFLNSFRESEVYRLI